ncbi:MAG: hypothetical protein H0Z37_00345 [Firmicutes bacterium]|nr:hypothetical protein [Bacillota bacterium]
MDYDYASHFALYLMHEEQDVWQQTEQDVPSTDDIRARFYLKLRGGGHR